MTPKSKKLNWKVLILSFIIVFAVAFIGSLFTDIGPWYESIKPSIAPPNYVFPVVWTILFLLIALSFYIALATGKQKKNIIGVYGVNFILNILWSYLFFTLKLPLFAFIEIIFLAISIILMISISLKMDKKAAYLLIPYLLWVLFATLLNYLIAF
jgi:translocator protein